MESGKALSLLIGATMAISFWGTNVMAVDTEITAETESLKAEENYSISSTEGLKKFSELVNNGNVAANVSKPTAVNPGGGAYISLTNDIDLGDVSDPDSGFNPIGTLSNSLNATFNGQGHTITLNLTRGDSKYIGSFGCVNENGTVYNLKVAGEVTGNDCVGGIVGRVCGQIINCSNIGTLKGTGIGTGGVVGLSCGGMVIGCSNTGAVSGTGMGVGGIVGWNCSDSSGNGGVVTNCFNTGAISGARTGGILGYNLKGQVIKSVNIGTIASTDDAGGVVGANNAGQVSNCSNIGNVTSIGSDIYSSAGGVVGSICHAGQVANCYNTGAVVGTRVGGVVGQNSGESVVKSCYYLEGTAAHGIGEGTAGEATGKTEAEMKDPAFAVALGEAFAFDVDNLNNGYPILAKI